MILKEMAGADRLTSTDPKRAKSDGGKLLIKFKPHADTQLLTSACWMDPASIDKTLAAHGVQNFSVSGSDKGKWFLATDRSSKGKLEKILRDHGAMTSGCWRNKEETIAMQMDQNAMASNMDSKDNPNKCPAGPQLHSFCLIYPSPLIYCRLDT
jgi:hypothetical protein